MKTLNRAFESEDTQEETEIEFKGPLATVCVDALRKVYAKNTGDNLDEDGDNKVIMESAEIDAEILSSISRMISTGDKAPDNVPAKTDVVYTVNKDEPTDETLVDLTKELANHNTESGQFIVVIDATKPSADSQTYSNPQEDIKNIMAVEALASAFNIPLYHSLKSFVLGYR